MLAMAMLSVWFDRRLALSSLAYFGGFLVASKVPESALWLLGFANLLGLGSSGLVIHRRLSARK